MINNGACGDCQCYEITVDARDPANYVGLFLYYQCCDGLFASETFMSGGVFNRCIRRVTGFYVIDRGAFVPPVFGSTYTSLGQGSCGNCDGCGTQC